MNTSSDGERSPVASGWEPGPGFRDLPPPDQKSVPRRVTLFLPPAVGVEDEKDVDVVMLLSIDNWLSRADFRR